MVVLQFINVEGPFVDAPADDLSVGVFQVAYFDHETVGLLSARIAEACDTYNVDHSKIKITL